MTVGENIKRIRIEKGLTQKQLGDLCGMADSAIRRYELGKANPKIETIQKIANALGVSIAGFLDNDLFDAVTLPDEEYEEKIIDTKFESIIENEKLSYEEKKDMVKDLLYQLEIMQNVHEKNAEVAGQIMLDALFNRLNYTGQGKAIEQVRLLTKIPEYQKEHPEE